MLKAFESIQKSTQTSMPIQFKLLPKIEHHVHAEGGTLTPDTITMLANKNQKPVPAEIFGPNQTLIFKEQDFFDFLAVYDKATSYILTTTDIQEVIYRYLKRCHQEGAIYIELTCSPDHVKRFRQTYEDVQAKLSGKAATSKELDQPVEGMEISYSQFVDAVAAGIDQANKEFGIEARIIMVLLRHNGQDAAMQTLDDLIAYPHPYVVGINLAGDENNFPPHLFKDCYAKAKKHGLKLTAHVGEHAGPEKIIEAVTELGLDRVGHGVTAIKNREVMQFLKEKRIALELCPTSNLALGLFPSLKDHPLKQFFDFGILFSINSDDPTFFGSSLGQEYDKVQAQWGFSTEQMLEICGHSITSSFADDLLKNQLFSYVTLYTEFNKLKSMLEPYKKNRIYSELEKYEKSPSRQQASVLASDVHDDFSNIAGIKEQGANFSKAHIAFEDAKLKHQSAHQQKMEDFTNPKGTVRVLTEMVKELHF